MFFKNDSLPVERFGSKPVLSTNAYYMYNHQVEYKTLAWSLKKLAVSVFSLLRQSLDSKSQVCRVFPLETR